MTPSLSDPKTELAKSNGWDTMSETKKDSELGFQDCLWSSQSLQLWNTFDSNFRTIVVGSWALVFVTRSHFGSSECRPLTAKSAEEVKLRVVRFGVVVGEGWMLRGNWWSRSHRKLGGGAGSGIPASSSYPFLGYLIAELQWFLRS